MIITIPAVLTETEVSQFRNHLNQADWLDGQDTAGSLAKHAKNNLQLADDTEPGLSLATHILRVLGSNPLFVSAALPQKLYPPKFNCYRCDGTYGAHVDSAIMHVPISNTPVRTDLSATLFLSDPDSYEGGELRILDYMGDKSFKLQAGDMILYPSTTVHEVTPVTRGTRLASFFWIQSMVRSIQNRELLFNLDVSIQALTAELGTTHPEVVRLSSIYHNLMRGWVDT